ncbi:DNA helicase PIF1, ATP-dependent [Corchorus olitorius]|uniref:ATP-dependent DNA helicase n=1 Tax=Corchorus olitorius TaxID=93759 RepID=A0A1R3KPN0_9ROSI|nr:DNA helicase PIF1, ATP-dependent [Corchorus olitorius]
MDTSSSVSLSSTIDNGQFAERNDSDLSLPSMGIDNGSPDFQVNRGNMIFSRTVVGLDGSVACYDVSNNIQNRFDGIVMNRIDGNSSNMVGENSAVDAVLHHQNHLTSQSSSMLLNLLNEQQTVQNLSTLESSLQSDLNVEVVPILESEEERLQSDLRTLFESSNFGGPTHQCLMCHAFMWYGERVNTSRNSFRPFFNLCCRQGMVKLLDPRPAPDFLRQLLDDKNCQRGIRFRELIRSYNSLFQFTSMGQQPKFSLVYMYDGDEELNYILARSFRYVRDMVHQNPQRKFTLTLSASRDHSSDVCAPPTLSAIPALIPNDIGYSYDGKDVIVEHRKDDLRLDPIGHFVIVKDMIHGSCRLLKPNATYTVDGNCNKNFPKEFRSETSIDDQGFPLYRRRNNSARVLVSGIELDNRTVDGVEYETYQDACKAMCLLGNDKEWIEIMGEDIKFNLERTFIFKNYKFHESDVRNYVLNALQQMLTSDGSSVQEHDLPLPQFSMYKNLSIYEEIRTSVDNLDGRHFFIYGHGGTGKTYLWNTLIAAIRSTWRIVLSVASSGIASLLLPGGRTAHSRFKIPLQVDDSSTCGIFKQTELAALMQAASLIIWDDAPMVDKNCIEELDMTLRDIMIDTDMNERKSHLGERLLFLVEIFDKYFLLFQRIQI